MKKLWDKLLEILPTLWGFILAAVITIGGLLVVSLLAKCVVQIWGGF